MRNGIVSLMAALAFAALVSCDNQTTIKQQESFVITSTTAFTKIKVEDITPTDYAPEAEVKFNRVVMNDGVALNNSINVTVVKEAYTQAKVNKITYTHSLQGDTYLVQYSVPRTSATAADKIYITFDVVSEKDIIIDMQNGDAAVSYDETGDLAIDTYTSSITTNNGNIDVTYAGHANIAGTLGVSNGNITLNIDKSASSNIVGFIVFVQINGTRTVDGVMFTNDSLSVGSGIPSTILTENMINGNMVINYIND